MKSSKIFILALGVLLAGPLRAQTTNPQDSTGLPGDNFSLSGALEMFKNANSLEDFEKAINTQNNGVNNLDLNGDGDIDYIRVIDTKDNDTHAVILQAAVSETESQDVAVIEIDKNSNDNAELQIVGDEDIYGEPVIIEPTPEQNQLQAPANNSGSSVAVNVWAWPSVRYVYSPSYTVWVSPWGWRTHPAWWHPWRPVRWHAFYPYRAPYYNRYVVVRRPRIIHAHRIYAPVRTTSVIVRTRHQPVITTYRTTRNVTPHHHSNNSNRVRTRTTTVHEHSGNGRGRETHTRTTRTRTSRGR